jgi:yersiniabactin nonribosomal peptide synthetase
MGEFTSLELLEVELGRDVSFGAFAHSLRTRLLRDLGRGDVSGLWVLREMATRRGELVTAPIVFTSLLGSPTSPLDELGKRVYALSQTPQVWLDHQVFESTDGVELSWDFVEQLFDRSAIAHVFEQYVRLVVALADAATWELSTPAAWASVSVGERTIPDGARSA